MQNKKLILASGSPRRKEILEKAGFDFEIRVSDVDEGIEFGTPADLVEKLSLIKAKDVANLVKAEGKHGLVIGADTVVALDGLVYGKPKDKEEAFEMLKSLRGRAHSVFTGVSLVDAISGRRMTFHDETKVFFKNPSDDELKAYIEGGEPMDKAGAYAIQGEGAFLIERIEGDYLNVVGLPLDKLKENLSLFEQNH
ncbi:MAG: septum formation inhibitor Maf [Lachnospiraceae bacterium]|nr:septum formation inhibitor Maf [Lachnospiraceae bacterium]